MLLLVTAYAVFNSAPFQNWLTSRLSDYLSAQFKTKISIGYIRYKPLQSFELDNVLFGDRKQDTLFFAGKLKFNLGGIELDSTRFRLKNVVVSDGYCHLKFYQDGTFNLDILTEGGDTTPTSGPPFVLLLDQVKLKNTRFKLVNELDTTTWEGFAPNHMSFYQINGEVEQFVIVNDSLNFKINHLDLKERSGLVVNHLSAKTIISPKLMSFDALKFRTPQSNIGNRFVMKYKSWDDFSDFNNKVKLEGELTKAIVDFKDITYFAPALQEFPYKVNITAQAKGEVANLNVKKIDLRFGKGGVFKGKVNLNGLPDIANTFIDADVQQLLVDRNDIEYLAMTKLVDELDRFGKITFMGKYTGFYTDFVAYGKVYSNLGQIESDLNMKLGADLRDYEYSGHLKLSQFNLGNLASQTQMGIVDGNFNVSGKGFDYASMQVKYKGQVSRFDFAKYAYSNIEIDGDFKNKVVHANMAINDPHLALDFAGEINLSTDIPKFDFNSDIKFAHIQPLGFDTMDLTISTNADINFSWKDIDHNDGEILLKNVELYYDVEEYVIDRFSVSSINRNGFRSLNVSSDHFKIDLNGQFNFTDLPDAFNGYLNHLLPAYFNKPQTGPKQNIRIEANIKSLYPISNLFFPELGLKNVALEAGLSQTNQEVVMNATADELAWGNMELRNIKINQEGTHKQALMHLLVKQFLVNDTLLTSGIQLGAEVGNNVASTQLTVSDTGSIFAAEVANMFNFYRDSISAGFSNTSFSIRNTNIYVNDRSRLSYSNKGLRFNNMLLTGNHFDEIMVDGLYGNNDANGVSVDIKQLDLALFNQFLPALGIQFGGGVNGKLNLKLKDENWLLTSDAMAEHVSLDQDTIGNFKIVSNYLDEAQRLMAVVKSTSGKLKNLQLGGFYDFKSPSDALNFTINFEESDITSFQAFLKDYVKLYAGNVRASATVNGSLKAPEINGDIDIMGVTLMVEYLKTMYSLSTHITLNEQRIQLTPTEIRDINDRKASLSGNIKHSNFSNFLFDLKLTDAKNFQLLNTTSKDNDLFYGTAYADGYLSLSGPVHDLVIDGKFTAKKGSLISIPLSQTYTDGDDGLVHFISYDSTSNLANRKRSGSISGFSFNCMLSVNKDAEIQIVFDEQAGDKIRGRGAGDLKLELTRSGQFNMYGEVQIEEGDYRFTAMNLFTKKFSLKRGGTIKWTGDPLTGQMNITGVYNVRTSMADVISVATNEEREILRQNRVPVECLLYLKGSLLSPDIKFDLNVNDINGNLSGNATSELQNTLRMWRNENDLMTQQVISLIVFGRFSPTNLQSLTSGGGNLSAGVNNTLSGFVSAQATNLIQKIIPGFNVNVDYRTGAESARSQTIFSASKTVFDNRLEIQANFDPINTYQNFLTQYNLTREGNMKIKAFSRAQLDPIYNRNVNTQGVGLYYRKEFERLGDLFSKKSKPVSNIE